MERGLKLFRIVMGLTFIGLFSLGMYYFKQFMLTMSHDFALGACFGGGITMAIFALAWLDHRLGGKDFL